jgi:ATP-binding cassette subfamily F protein uup
MGLMSLLVGIQNLGKAFGTQNLFDKISFTISEGDRIGVIGPNGAGKSTLLKILMEIEPQDSGKISRKGGLRVGYASQEPDFPDEPVEDILVKSAIEGDDYERHTQARILLSKGGFVDNQQMASKLSGGWKKRLAILMALMKKPDLLLLDEPTNHLDLEGILWLEQFLKREAVTFLVVSHDRYFLEHITNRTIELNRCYLQGILTCDGSLSRFVEQREDFLRGQEEQERALRGIVRDEIDWLRRSPKARTTKSQSRIDRAYGLMDELSDLERRNKKERVDIDFASSERNTRKLIVAKNVSKSLGGKELFKGIDITLSPGKCLGIVGANGTGKTTLMRMLANQLQPDMGTIKYADELKLVYFDQHRERVPTDVSLRRALAPNSDMVTYLGRPMHVNGFARKFLFSSERMELPVGCLSGGERARILIAKLMLEPADILFLDEPTNDLDIPTLEVIEESIKEFPGAVVLISHDRYLMDRVCTEVIGLGENCESQIFADYAQWEEACKQEKSKAKPKETRVTAPKINTPKKKLTFTEQHEYDKIPGQIESAELELEELLKKVATSDHSIYKEIEQTQKKLETLYNRWEELEKKK